MQLTLDPTKLEDYRTFIAVKKLPRYSVSGETVEFPDEYASLLGLPAPNYVEKAFTPSPFLFDYQGDITGIALAKRKFAAFVRCGYGKTLILWEWVRHLLMELPPGKCVLIVSPLMVVRQTIEEAVRFYGNGIPAEQVRAANLQAWLGGRRESNVGITNYEAISDKLTSAGDLWALALDESSMLKSHYGKWGSRLIDLGAGLRYKLCLTGTPAPNDRIEYGNHAVFLDQFPNVNSFLARFFVNRGKTNERWELKPHALRPFYQSLAHWSIFLSNPAVYGWKDNVGVVPPVHVHEHQVPLTPRQEQLAQEAGWSPLGGSPGGIVSRSRLAQIAKGTHNGRAIPTNKPAFIRDLIASWPTESTIVWCKFNPEQDHLAKFLPDAASIAGKTPHEERERIVKAFQAGEVRVLISKPEVLGFGLNLQIATRHVFSTCQDSWEDFHQCVSRSNRLGSTLPLNVHAPLTDIERPMFETVLRKAATNQRDTEEQELLFREIQQVRKEAI